MTPRFVFVTLLALAPGLACDWREFDKTVVKAPVASVTAPDGFSSGDFGRVLLALDPPRGNAKAVARFLAASPENPSVAVMDFDAVGGVVPHNIPEAVLADMIAGKGAVKSAALLADGRVLLGSPNYGTTSTMPGNGRLFFLSVKAGDLGLEFVLIKGAEPPTGSRRLGLGVAAGNISGSPTAQDFVAVSQTDVVLYEDGSEQKDKVFIASAQPKCAGVELSEPLYQSGVAGFRAVAVGDFLQGNDADEIAVGAPHDGAPGTVLIMAKVGGVLDCPVVLSAPADLAAATASAFGTSLAVGDFDGDGKKDDLLVGAPPERAFLYLGPITATSMPARVLQVPDVPPGGVTGGFGTRVAAVDVDGMPGPELVVSAPDLSYRSVPGGGQVFVFRSDGSLFAKVGDHDPEDHGGFGNSIAELKFAAPACATGAAAGDRTLLSIGSRKEVFTYFQLPGGPADPRCFGN